jgi:hypothetical protein
MYDPLSMPAFVEEKPQLVGLESFWAKDPNRPLILLPPKSNIPSYAKISDYFVLTCIYICTYFGTHSRTTRAFATYGPIL